MSRFTSPKRAVAWALLAVAMTVSACSSGASAAAAVDGREAHALVAAGATLVDVRTPAEWRDGHIDGAVLIPVQELEQRLQEIARDRPVVVYCASGNRSARAAATLSAAGYDVHDLGGMSRWGG